MVQQFDKERGESVEDIQIYSVPGDLVDYCNVVHGEGREYRHCAFLGRGALRLP